MVATRIRYGQRRIYVLRRQGWMVTVQRVVLIYREGGLSINPPLDIR